MKKIWSSISLASVLLFGGIAGCNAQDAAGDETNKQPAKEKENKKTEQGKTAKEKKEEEKKQAEAPKPKPAPKPKDITVKGVYMSGAAAGMNSKFNELTKLVDDTELNSLVVDVKGDSGEITYDSNVPEVNSYGSDKHPPIKNMKQRLKVMKDKDIYTIARVVTFKDPYMAKKKPAFAMKKKSGGLYYNDGIPWVDPYKEQYWKYVTSIAKEAAKLGFDEIQFDYVRFPDNGAQVDREVKFDNPKKKSKAQNIHDFLTYAKKELKPYGVNVSADVFGVSTSAKGDTGIGQQWESLTQAVDVMSPMTYPSHYGPGEYGIKVPDAEPYKLIKSALQPAIQRDKALEKQKKHAAKIRPWYQDFTATWVDGHITYGSQQVKDQIRAGKELGIDGYLLWNASNEYTKEALQPKN
ncbi:putative glycoside hydrolase [Fictibacillus enclensis]|uniref:putative glycoside hydrolase n=1 Tax=Fictibacillus enclensis TaxID=1017270 RepID=UPI0025A0BFF4|nr:putative glycoside hydrolase [Fictibacillus enclensis]MDM5200232.1 putative glycoside hydrolase [Fictibacillus enclensis]